MEPLSGVTITAREIYDAVVRLTGRCDVMISNQEHAARTDQDHETRIRLIEKGRWPLPSLAVLISLGAIALSFLRT